MAIYKAKPGQNLFDIAIMLYGSIEGLFDVLISNPALSMNTDIKAGMELEYHDYFVINPGITSELQKKQITPSNGERHVYYKESVERLRAICIVSANADSSSFIVSGTGSIIIDWGDDSDLEVVILSIEQKEIVHYFDNISEDNRQLKIYGNSFSLMHLDTSNIGGDLLPLSTMIVDEYHSNLNSHSLKGLFLFEGTVKLDLQGVTISELSPIYDMSLQILNLTDVKFTDISVLDDYLVYISENYGNRRDCTVYLDSQPSQTGMDAIQKIINEPAWNEAGKWKFIINDKIYTKE